MTAHPPPVPPANRTDKGPAAPPAHGKAPNHVAQKELNTNPDEQGEQGNMHQNTTNAGHQADHASHQRDR